MRRHQPAKVDSAVGGGDADQLVQNSRLQNGKHEDPVGLKLARHRRWVVIGILVYSLAGIAEAAYDWHRVMSLRQNLGRLQAAFSKFESDLEFFLPFMPVEEGWKYEREKSAWVTRVQAVQSVYSTRWRRAAVVTVFTLLVTLGLLFWAKISPFGASVATSVLYMSSLVIAVVDLGGKGGQGFDTFSYLSAVLIYGGVLVFVVLGLRHGIASRRLIKSKTALNASREN